MLNVVALKKSKSLSWVNNEKFLKSGGVKSNDENLVKSNDGIPSPHSKWECKFFWWFFK